MQRISAGDDVHHKWMLSAAEGKRAFKTLQKLSRHDISGWALAGGLAVELHCLRAGLPYCVRPLNDIDFVTERFDRAPETMSEDFLFRHVHPLEPAGKMMLQFIDAENTLRIDLFRAHRATMERTLLLDFPFGPMQLISGEDVLAHAARLLLDLRADVPVPAKHANDYLRLMKAMQAADLETAWQDHRKANDPVSFREVNTMLQSLISTHHKLLSTPVYSNDAKQVCARCVPIPGFPLADPSLVLSLLGYC